MQQLCLAHAVHLAVFDVLFKQRKCAPIEEADNGTDNESDDVDKGEGFQIVNEEDKLELKNNLHQVIRKVRTVVKLFRKSPTKNDILQKNIKEQFGREIQLMINVKIQWNSLV